MFDLLGEASWRCADGGGVRGDDGGVVGGEGDDRRPRNA